MTLIDTVTSDTVLLQQLLLYRGVPKMPKYRSFQAKFEAIEEILGFSAP
jgi:hypothetical protein